MGLRLSVGWSVALRRRAPPGGIHFGDQFERRPGDGKEEEEEEEEDHTSCPPRTAGPVAAGADSGLWRHSRWTWSSLAGGWRLEAGAGGWRWSLESSLGGRAGAIPSPVWLGMACTLQEGSGRIKEARPAEASLALHDDSCLSADWTCSRLWRSESEPKGQEHHGRSESDNGEEMEMSTATSSSLSLPSSLRAGQGRGTLDLLLSTTYCRSQLYLSRQLAQLHPELTMPMFSGLSKGLEAGEVSSQGFH
ncbi:Protein furry [Frankliniella fusca]|uniref:Protein furry n=1 Tax=Frankliniella fusca TaxID=407009 RepID=A0AAE1HIB3_9NEOP|nr:Protein furry [Frankliniella fusca]